MQTGQHSPGGVIRTPSLHTGRKHVTAEQFPAWGKLHDIVYIRNLFVVLVKINYICEECSLAMHSGQHSPGGVTRIPSLHTGRKHVTAEQSPV